MYNHRPYRVFLRAIFITLAPLFFSVQLFFNLDITGNTYRNSIVSTHVSPQRGIHSCTKAARIHAGFRLNKHYQPQTLPALVSPVVSCPVAYMEVNRPLIFPDFHYAAPLHETPALRGPPAVNNFS